MADVTRYDNIVIKAELTSEGWIVDRPVITRAGIFNYHDSKGKIVREYRPDEEVFNQDSLNSLRAIPITDGHRGIVTSESELDGLVVGSVMSPGEKADEHNVVADIVIHNVKKIGARRDLSLGYRCRVDETPGDWNGKPYDQVQRSIRYNHLAVVHKGRAGNARLRLDSDELVSFETEDDMADVALAKVRLDSGLEYSAAPEVVVHISTLNDKIKDVQTRLDKAEAERDTAKSALETVKQDHLKALGQERAKAKSRVVLEDKAKQLSLKFDAEIDTMTDRDIKMAIVRQLGNNLNFTDRSDDYVDSAYDLAVANADARAKTTADQKTKTTTKQDSKSSSGYSSADARAKMVARIRGEKEAA